MGFHYVDAELLIPESEYVVGRYFCDSYSKYILHFIECLTNIIIQILQGLAVINGSEISDSHLYPTLGF